jgi:hypothetical protein
VLHVVVAEVLLVIDRAVSRGELHPLLAHTHTALLSSVNALLSCSDRWIRGPLTHDFI